MRKYFYILVMMTLICQSHIVFAQVTIGDNTKAPASYSLLQLESANKKGGLRLPQLSDAQCSALANEINSKSLAERMKANGLVVFNTTKNMAQFWDGNAWVTFTPAAAEAVGVNGLSAANPKTGILELGGSLNKTTEIGLGVNNLNFGFSGTTDSLMVTKDGDSTFVVGSNGNVGIGTNAPQASLDVYSSNSSGLKITNSGEGSGFGYLMVSDANGNGTWKAEKPLSAVVRGTLKDNRIAYTNNQVADLTEKRITLTKGKWLIVAKFTSYCDDSGSDASGLKRGLNSYLVLYKNYTGTVDRFSLMTSNPYIVAKSSAQPAQNGTNPDGSGSYYYATPQLFYYVEVDSTPDTFGIAGTSSASTKTSAAYGGSYFFALRIDN